MRVHLLLVSIIVVASAATTPSYAKGNNHSEHNKSTIHSNSHTNTNGHGGIASVYSTDSGSRTAQGGWLNPGALTAGHRSLRFGTKVRVTNNKNGRSVFVTINDRGQFVRGRVIDLTPATPMPCDFPASLQLIWQ